MLRSLESTLWSAALNVHTLCHLDPTFDFDRMSQTVSIGGRGVDVIDDWLNCGDAIAGGQIDAFIDQRGFTITLPDTYHTKFALDDSPDPTQCAVVYEESLLNADDTPRVSALSGGC